MMFGLNHKSQQQNRMTKENLLNTLEELIEKEFQDFKWFLKDESLAGYQTIKASRLENAERQHTVDLMVQTYQLPGAVEVTKKLLGKMNRNDLWEILSYISGSIDFSELKVDQNKLKRVVTSLPDNNRTERRLTEGPDQWSQPMWTEGRTDHSYRGSKLRLRAEVDISVTSPHLILILLLLLVLVLRL